MSESEKEEALLKCSKLRPGDLILIKTPNPLYAAMRRLYNSTYDHVVVVCDE